MIEQTATQRLLVQVQGGSEEALNELCRRYQQRVLAAVRIRLGANLRRKVESWDLVQNVMIDAIRKAHSFDFRTEGAFLKYVNRLVENRIRDAARHWKAERRAMDREMSIDAGLAPDSDAPVRQVADLDQLTPSKILGLQEDLERLEQAMDQLSEQSPEQRELLIAVKLEGCTYQELAEDLGVTEDAVRMRVRRAMESLTKVFQQFETEKRQTNG